MPEPYEHIKQGRSEPRSSERAARPKERKPDLPRATPAVRQSKARPQKSPMGCTVKKLVEGQPLQIGAVGVHHVDLRALNRVLRPTWKGYLLAIG